jgi:hypothetical protein
MLSNLFNQVTTETSTCASSLWDLILQGFPLRSPQVVAGLIAEAAVKIMRGPDHGALILRKPSPTGMRLYLISSTWVK